MSHTLLIFIGLIMFSLAGMNSYLVTPMLQEDQDTLYQVSTIQNLSAGGYDGYLTLSQLKKQGDFGIGTFNKLDGEMIVLNNTVYQVKSNGTIVNPSDYEKIPFVMLTYFDAYNTTIVNSSNGSDLENSLNKTFPQSNIFYAIKIEGNFSHIKARSVPEQNPPYKNLSEVIKNQTVFEFNNTNGTIVGFWCPNNMGGINNPGFHFHFISQNKTEGGHVLEFAVDNATMQVDDTPKFYMNIPMNGF
ncbi:MAG: acetolactate decarboxylase [Methanobacteriaceae archaeon]|nr:acetolactate decarboxylase [Methanobacteriaceae archaeon]